LSRPAGAATVSVHYVTSQGFRRGDRAGAGVALTSTRPLR
jgi:hypothetical protein